MTRGFNKGKGKTTQPYDLGFVQGKGGTTVFTKALRR
jgi:hypothetical protein